VAAALYVLACIFPRLPWRQAVMFINIRYTCLCKCCYNAGHVFRVRGWGRDREFVRSCGRIRILSGRDRVLSGRDRAFIRRWT